MNEMNDAGRVDLEALAPERWEERVAATLLRVEPLLVARRRDPLTLIASWSRHLLIAAAVAIAILIPAELVLEVREADAERVQRLVHFSTRAALGADAPTGAELARALGHDLQP